MAFRLCFASFCALCLGAVWLAGPAAAQSSGGLYAITKESLAGGGGSAAGGAYALTGSIGQADAAVQAGGSYQLTGGFHGSGPPPNDTVFENGFE